MDQKTPLSTLFSGELEGTERFLDYGDVDLACRASALTLRDFCKRHRACRPEVMEEGLSFLMGTAKESRCVYSLYEEGECREDETRRDVRLYAFPGGEGAEKRPVVLICAGGGYAYVCNIVEGFPVAKRFCEQGYDAYVLNYRVGTAPALPRASEDLERAVRFVAARCGGRGYVLCGFSAGGNLITQWGTDNFGFSARRLPAPRALLAIYPALITRALCSDFRHIGFLKRMFGALSKEDILAAYDVMAHSEGFPPTYVAVGKHDILIDRKPLMAFCAKLQQRGILSHLDVFPRAPHGFGEGTGTGAEGWISRAVAFLGKV